MTFGLYRNAVYRDASLANLHKEAPIEIKKLLEKIHRDAVKSLPNIYVYGKHRIGKTYLLHAIANYFLSINEKRFYFISAKTLSNFFVKTVYHKDYDNVSWKSYLVNKNILLLDDLGRENITSNKFIEKEMESFLSKRFNNGKKTIITSNFSIGELEVRYSDWIKNFILGEYIDIGIDSNVNMSELIKMEKYG